ncbi:hypothetical protein SNE40_009484 [Patella caerulea]|uniref:Secreted protein n=1 Tax=Patella caerulea TaxID=87958 RepID=A0AAN8PYI2_PATCE
MAFCSSNCVFVVLLLLSLVLQSQTFRVQNFCASRCSRGRGGNLCRCSGFHFAGKRSELGYDPSRVSDDFASWALNTRITDKIRKRHTNIGQNIATATRNYIESSRTKRFQSILERILAHR